MNRLSRRDVLSGITCAGMLLSRAEAQVTPELVRFRPDMEPLVRLMEETPREKCAEMVANQLRQGVSYRQLLGALFLAGIRNVNPRPPGFAMHCVFVIHSAHLLGLEAPADVRMLPLFYAMDVFKASQERDARQNDYAMHAIRGSLPAAEKAGAELQAAMEAWDQERAERAVVSLARQRSAGEVFDLLWRYGARDYRNIGHKAIYTANAYRTLHTIGWQHAEPVLRSLVLALLDFGRSQEVNGYKFEDQCYAANQKHGKETFSKLPAGWAEDSGSGEATRGALGAIRTASPSEACADVAGRLAKGNANAGAIWDAVHLAGAELAMRARNIVGIHAVTAANGLRHCYMAATDPQVRHLLLLQGVGWMGQFRSWAESREQKPRAFPIADLPTSKGSLEEVFEGFSDADATAGRVIGLAKAGEPGRAFLSAAIRHTITKANEVHYYKYLAALIDDIPLASPEWQPHLTASAVYYMKGPKDPEPAAMKRAREVLG